MKKESFISINVLWLNAVMHSEKLGELTNVRCPHKRANGSEVRNHIMSKEG